MLLGSLLCLIICIPLQCITIVQKACVNSQMFITTWLSTCMAEPVSILMPFLNEKLFFLHLFTDLFIKDISPLLRIITELMSNGEHSAICFYFLLFFLFFYFKGTIVDNHYDKCICISIWHKYIHYTFALTCTIVSFTHIHTHTKTTYIILLMNTNYTAKENMHRSVTYMVHHIINHVTALVLIPLTYLHIPCQCSYTICIFLLSLLIHSCTILDQYVNVCVYLLMNTIKTLCISRNQ